MNQFLCKSQYWIDVCWIFCVIEFKVTFSYGRLPASLVRRAGTIFLSCDIVFKETNSYGVLFHFRVLNIQSYFIHSGRAYWDSYDSTNIYLLSYLGMNIWKNRVSIKKVLLDLKIVVNFLLNVCSIFSSGAIFEERQVFFTAIAGH